MLGILIRKCFRLVRSMLTHLNVCPQIIRAIVSYLNTFIKLNSQLDDSQFYIQRQRRGLKTNINPRAEMAKSLQRITYYAAHIAFLYFSEI